MAEFWPVSTRDSAAVWLERAARKEREKLPRSKLPRSQTQISSNRDRQKRAFVEIEDHLTSKKERERGISITEIEKITEIDRRELLSKSKIIKERSKSPSSTGERERNYRDQNHRDKEEREITEIDGRERAFETTKDVS